MNGRSSRRSTSARGVRRWLGAPLVSIALVAGAACLAVTAGAATAKSTVTLTEIDYYNSPPGSTAIGPLLKTCAAKAGVTIQHHTVPQANLIPQLLQDVGTHSYPNLALVDNPNVQQMAQTGAIISLSGINTRGIFPSIASAGSYHGKTYGIATGVNDLAIYYNKADLTAAGLTPPKTWGELHADASKLTSSSHGTYGFAFSAPSEEEATWDFEPFFWGNGASLAKINSSQAVQALTFLDGMVSDGSVSKEVVNWTQADVEEQFAAGHAAMMINGPWQLPVLNAPGTPAFGIVPLPVPKAGDKPGAPRGGETWTVGKSSAAKEAGAVKVVQCLLSPAQSLKWSKTVGYISTDETVAHQMAASNAQLAAFVSEIGSAKARTGPPANLGPKYNTISQAIWTAVQSVITGQATPTAALGNAAASVGQ